MGSDVLMDGSVDPGCVGDVQLRDGSWDVRVGVGE